MCKLLSANFIRIKKDNFFWIGISFMLVTGIVFPIIRYQNMQQTQTIYPIDNGFFSCSLFIGIIMAVFCSLFLGTEYSDGTLRNKIIIGHIRISIYLANFITCSIISIVMCTMFFIPYLCIGLVLLGSFVMDIKTVFLFTITVFMLAIVFSSMFTFISMLNHNRTVSAVLCILLAFLLLMMGAQCNKMLSEPETNMGLKMSENDQEILELPNAKFLEKQEREVVQFIYDFLPGGQVLQCTSLEAENLMLLPMYSIIITLLTTSAGALFFQKKELR